MSLQLPIFVKVPFCHGQHRFKIFKGQRWGVVDHLLLQEVVKAARSAIQLSESSGLPRRLIIEIMIPFMRVGWIQISQQDKSYIFQATPRGWLSPPVKNYLLIKSQCSLFVSSLSIQLREVAIGLGKAAKFSNLRLAKDGRVSSWKERAVDRVGLFEASFKSRAFRYFRMCDGNRRRCGWLRRVRLSEAI